MSLVDIKHQGRAQTLLQRAMRRARVPHAYVFHGPEGLGKESLAMGFAQLLVCGEPVDRRFEADEAAELGLDELRTACGACEDCRIARAGTHPDLHLVHRRLNREHPDPEVRKRKATTLSIDVLRHFVIQKVGLTPARGRAKVFVIREADLAKEVAQNALLKTLEEPPSATFIILLVSALDQLLPTTLSRCQLVPFDPLPTPFVRRRLAELVAELPDDRAEWYARSSDGSLGSALRSVEDDLFEFNARTAEGLESLARRGDADMDKAWLDMAKALGARGRRRDPDMSDAEAAKRGLKTVFRLAAGWFADVLRAGSGSADSVVSAGSAKQIEQVARTVDPERAAEAIGRIARAERHLDQNVHTQLCVETLISDLAVIVGATEEASVR